MEITLYQYNGNALTVGKTLADGLTVTGVLYDGADVMNPVVTVRGISPSQYNYAYIPDFKRYYFITGHATESNDTVTLRMDVDVLQTYASDIKQSTGNVTQSDTPNAYASSRVNVYDMRPKWEKIEFPNKELFTKDGSITMVTIKGKEN